MKNSATQTNTGQGDCLSILYPKFVNDTTYLDRVRNTNTGVVLKTFIKNICTDSIEISLTSLGLYIGPIEWYFNDGDVIRDNIEYLIEKKVIMAPNDSIFLSIAELDSPDIDKLDSIHFWLQYENSSSKVIELTKVYKKDF